MMVGQFAYASGLHAPQGYIYQISQVLETPRNTLSIRRAHRRADMLEYPLAPDYFPSDDALYVITRSAPDYQEFELQGKEQAPDAGTIKMQRDWMGGWNIYDNAIDARDFLFRTTPDWSKRKEEECRWMSKEGVLLARSGWEDATPNLCFEAGAERLMQDLLVACWVAKLWSETAVAQRRDSMSVQ